jgi:hypothetical protein
MSWYTDRPSATRTGAARPWLPPLLPAEPEADPSPSTPALRFDEAELARIAAGLVERTAHAIRAEAAASPAARQADALDRAVAALEAAVRRQDACERAAVPRILALAAAIGRALGPTARDPHGLALLAGQLLAGLEAPTARLAAAPEVIEALRPLLPEIATRAGFVGGVELEADPRLADGALRLAWPGGWLARDPEEAARQVAALLAQPPEDPVPSQGKSDDQS